MIRDRRVVAMMRKIFAFEQKNTGELNAGNNEDKDHQSKDVP